jgi:hypothetical protein
MCVTLPQDALNLFVALDGAKVADVLFNRKLNEYAVASAGIAAALLSCYGLWPASRPAASSK